MGAVTVLRPLGTNRIDAQPITPRLATLDGVTLGILNNNKPNSLLLQQRVVELLSKKYKVGDVVTKQKSSFIPTFGTSKSVTRKIEGEPR